MSDASITTDALPSESTVRSGKPMSTWQRIGQSLENKLATWLEWANPILVKETRQALKSRQFLITFAIVLIACWIVSFAGRAVIGPQIFYIAAGGEMLIAYYAILAFPLMVIVPFTAFRSISVEQEDQTYDLLSITTLTSKQIISGKLGSAALQIMLYFSAVSPCIAFTFLLRGVDLIAVMLLLGVTLLVSLGLAMIGLLAGTLANVRYTQMLITVGVILSLAGVFVGAVSLVVELLPVSYQYIKDWDFWVGFLAVLTAYATTFGLLHAAAAAQISFPSENRSTSLRVWMLIQQTCFLGWLAVPAAIYPGERMLLPVLAFFAVIGCTVYWYLMGTLMTGDWPQLSRRVQRSLPQSTFARALLSWFNPGPASGYVFAIANLTMVILAALLCLLFLPRSSSIPPNDLRMAAYFLVISWSYVVAFLGAGRLLVSFLRRFTFVPLPAAFLLHMILLLAGVGIPTIIHATLNQFRSSGYSLLQIANPFWTLVELSQRGVAAVQGDVLIVVLPAIAVVVFLLNLRAIGAELNRHRSVAPLRVVEDEQDLHPAPEPVATNPWDAAPNTSEADE